MVALVDHDRLEFMIFFTYVRLVLSFIHNGMFAANFLLFDFYLYTLHFFYCGLSPTVLYTDQG